MDPAKIFEAFQIQNTFEKPDKQWLTAFLVAEIDMLIHTDFQKLSELVEVKSLETITQELFLALEDLNLTREKLLELTSRLAETEEISEIRRIAEEMEKILEEN